jgi:ABC-type branched-subunit amino acid transport system permease subunit
MTAATQTRRFDGFRTMLADPKRQMRVVIVLIIVTAIYATFYNDIRQAPGIRVIFDNLPLPSTNVLIIMFYYAILALGLNIVVGFAGLLDLGYVAFYVFGAYTTAFLASPLHGLHVPWWIVVWVAVLVAALAGVLLGAPTLRLRGDYLAIVTLGFGEILPSASATAASAGPGWRSARTRPRRPAWALTRSARSSSRSAWGPASRASPAPSLAPTRPRSSRPRSTSRSRSAS